MKGLALILFCTASGGCALVHPAVPVYYWEAALPAAVQQALADQAHASIVTDFNPGRARLGFFSGSDRFAIAARLDDLLRESGYEVAIQRGDTAQEHSVDGETAFIAYSAEPASPGYLYFTISVGPDWRLSRLYFYTQDGQILPHTPATIKRNGLNVR